MSPLQYIRALITLLVAPILTFIVSLLALFDLLILKRPPSKAMRFPRFWGKTICRLAGVTVRIEGLGNIEPTQTYIFAANHVSQFDIFSFQGYFPHDFRWIAKKELFRIPFFGPAMRKADFIPIDRSKGRQAMRSLNEAAKRIAAGTSVLIFPEGTRSPDGRLHPFKAGTSMLAIKAEVPIVPIAFKGSYEILPKKSLLAYSGHIVIRIGTPVPTGNYKIKEKQVLANLLQEKVTELQAIEETLPLPGVN